MNLTFEEVKLFYDLYAVLLSFANRKLAVSPEQFSDFQEYMSTPPQARVEIRDALFAHPELIDEFVQENPANLEPADLEIVASWKHALPGEYYIFRYLKKYTVFLTSDGSPRKAYGVLGLIDPLEEVLAAPLPRLVATVLLPFQGRIIYDGLMPTYSITFGGGLKRALNQEYKEAKEAFGIITSIGNEVAPAAKSPKKPKQRPRKPKPADGGRSAAGEAKAVAEAIVQLTDAFCLEFLNEEYAELCRKLTAALARKRPSPLLRGRRETWACGIVRTIGWVNFLHDPSQGPHLPAPAIDEAFGISQSTGAAKSKTIRTMLRIHQLDPKWTLPSMIDDNPLVWMLEVDGFIVDIRHAPREIQEMAFEKGLIPYIPADRAEEDA